MVILLCTLPLQEEDPADHPPELQCLVRKSFLFKDQINKDNIKDPEGTKLHVQRICNDHMVTQAFLNQTLVH